MGWTTTHVPKGQAGDYLKKNFSWESETSKGELLQGAFVSFKEYYAAVRTTDKATGKSYVWGLVVLLSYAPHEYHNFGYKDMDETMGPYSCNCPESILKLLSPVEETGVTGSGMENASKWREACWKRVNAKKLVKSIVKDRSIIKFKEELRFTNGDHLDTFVVRKTGRAIRLYAYNALTKTHIPYRSYKLRQRDYVNIEVLGAVPSTAQW